MRPHWNERASVYDAANLDSAVQKELKEAIETEGRELYEGEGYAGDRDRTYRHSGNMCVGAQV